MSIFTLFYLVSKFLSCNTGFMECMEIGLPDGIENFRLPLLTDDQSQGMPACFLNTMSNRTTVFLISDPQSPNQVMNDAVDI